MTIQMSHNYCSQITLRTASYACYNVVENRRRITNQFQLPASQLHIHVFTYTSSISSSSESYWASWRYGLSLAGRNLTPVVMKKTRLAHSLKSWQYHSYWNGSEICNVKSTFFNSTKVLAENSTKTTRYSIIIPWKKNDCEFIRLCEWPDNGVHMNLQSNK